MTIEELFDRLIANGSIGCFNHLEYLGQGGFGVVLLAHDVLLRRQVALKFPRDQEASFDYLLHEARVLASLSHPNILCIHSAQREAITATDDILFLVTEYAAGGDLATRVRNGVLSPTELIAVLTQVSTGLAAAHRCGIIHRDVKPENVLLDVPGRTLIETTFRLADFGIARHISRPAGGVLGTSGYMAPETWDGISLPQSDVYALGVMAYRLMSGRVPFTGNSTDDWRRQHAHDIPAPINVACPSCPSQLAALIHRALEKDFANRPAHAAEFLEMLQELGKPKTVAASKSDPSRKGTLPKFTIWANDVLKADVQAIAYSANNRLEFSGGLAKVLSELGGPQLVIATQAICADLETRSVPIGEVVVTPAFGLEARGIQHILHAATLYWNPLAQQYVRRSASAYLQDIATAAENVCRVASELNNLSRLGLTLFGLGVRHRLYHTLDVETLIATNVQGWHRYLLSIANKPDAEGKGPSKTFVVSAFDRRRPEAAPELFDFLRKQLGLIRVTVGKLTDANAEALIVSANNWLYPGTGNARAAYDLGGEATQAAIERIQPVTTPLDRGTAIAVSGGNLEDLAGHRRLLIQTVTTWYDSRTESGVHRRVPASPRDIYIATVNAIREAVRNGTRTIALSPMCTRSGFHTLNDGEAPFHMGLASIQAVNDVRTEISGKVDHIEIVVPDSALCWQLKRIVPSFD